MSILDDVPVFQFKQVNGEWKAHINGELAFVMHNQYGMPAEITEQIINDSPYRLHAMVSDWINQKRDNPH